MEINFLHNQKIYKADLSKPLDISIAYSMNSGVQCFHSPKPDFSPVVMGDFVGSVKQGSPVNFYDVKLNPHGNGTHTECLGHITEEQESVNKELKQFHFLAELISVTPKKLSNGDEIIELEEIQAKFKNEEKVKALVIRTLPNSKDKLNKNYTSTNPPYLNSEAMQYIVNQGIEHLLIDLPSVDKEMDDGKVACHKIFWQTETPKPRKDATITELIYVPSEIEDGLYFLNLQIAPIDLDATPSKPILYKTTTNG